MNRWIPRIVRPALATMSDSAKCEDKRLTVRFNVSNLLAAASRRPQVVNDTEK